MKSPKLSIVNPQGTDAEMRDQLLRETFDYFLQEQEDTTGLIPDSTMPDSPCSVAVMGIALNVYLVGVRRGIISRDDALKRSLKILRFFAESKQGPEKDSTGYQGFYYHFIHKVTGARAWDCELSTIDTALFIAGALASAQYFDGKGAEERELVRLAGELYRRIDWKWARDGEETLSHGWKPEGGFLPDRWNQGYNEAMLMYVLALGSPTFPISETGYTEWTSTFELRDYGSGRYFYAGPLFIHQLSQLWLDLRGVRDEAGRRASIDYFENSRRATYAQRAYALRNPQGFAHYGECCWGFTASDGPGPAEKTVHGKRRKFYGYAARGAPDDIDDGTISPWAVVASLPFAPDIVHETIRHAIEKLDLKNGNHDYGFDASFNPTFPGHSSNPNGWVSPWRFGLNQGPIVIMIENYESGLLWKTMARCPYVTTGLKRAGFLPSARL